jgi:hypothetical protein
LQLPEWVVEHGGNAQCVIIIMSVWYDSVTLS